MREPLWCAHPPCVAVQPADGGPGGAWRGRGASFLCHERVFLSHQGGGLQAGQLQLELAVRRMQRGRGDTVHACAWLACFVERSCRRSGCCAETGAGAVIGKRCYWVQGMVHNLREIAGVEHEGVPALLDLSLIHI